MCVRSIRSWALCFLTCTAAFISSAQAEWILIPESLHQQYHTLGLFIDQQSVLYFRDAKRAWGSISGNIALLEQSEWYGKPQLVLSASANTGFGITSKMDALLTETIDARAGLAVNWAHTERLRFSVGWQHQSGHISDNVRDADLIGSNLGNEIFYVRTIWDPCKHLRVGATLKPYVGSEPKMKAFAADQFVEWFPLGTAENPRKPTPFIAGGIEQYGPRSIEFSWNINGGVYIGNHMQAVHMTSARLAVGYYDGMDPRMKYAQFKNGRINFAYFGLGFDI